MGPQTNDCYKSISAPSEGIYKEKGSKFLAFAYPVESEAQIKDLISKIKKEYFDARHHCYAYRLRHDYSIWRANDDGEPYGEKAVIPTAVFDSKFFASSRIIPVGQ